ncbi:hypothetical protein CMI47_12105 [Candidatus Pacearchaeota archaeon]|jgi:CRISPR/Cas system-associated exonuclease Cas4 (RecB family)|nr:hypothetical protein [Candidatus Pacearchaeota archaeon]|tara:strand:+ start:4481 stop:5257 length:777 start_codon:yes stop_codon:yes gene_type:complete
MIEKIYHEYLEHKNEENRKNRYDGNESWYHASGAGFCSRKLYYESVEQAVPSNPPNEKSSRIMRVGSIIHEDIQNALIYYNNINNNNINIEPNKINIAVQSVKKFDTEGEIKLPEFKVRGFYDIFMRDCSASNTDSINRLYDLKTSSTWGFRQKFNKKNAIPLENRNHFLQVATYGLALKKKYGNLDSMSIIYYNKDNSDIREQIIPNVYLDKARKYWHSINAEHARGLPVFQLGTSPAYSWSCGYCQFKDHCNPPKF